MRKTTFAAITAAALILAGIEDWAAPSNLALQVKASTAIGAQIDILRMMASAKDLPKQISGLLVGVLGADQ